MARNTVTFCLGPAGGGKTYIAAGYAASLLADGAIERIVLCRPMIQAGPQDEIGFLPGGVGEKTGPFMEPLFDALGDFFSHADIAKLGESGAIQVKPISMIRGKSLRSSFVIVDEAQNCTAQQIRLVLTRIESGSKVVLAGDQDQTDIRHCHSILEVSEWLTADDKIPGVGRVLFTHEDNQRDPIVSMIDKSFARRM